MVGHALLKERGELFWETQRRDSATYDSAALSDVIAILYVNFRPKIGVIYDTLPLRINSLSPQVYLSLKESFHTVYISLPKINILLIYFFWLISKN